MAISWWYHWSSERVAGGWCCARCAIAGSCRMGGIKLVRNSLIGLKIRMESRGFLGIGWRMRDRGILSGVGFASHQGFEGIAQGRSRGVGGCLVIWGRFLDCAPFRRHLFARQVGEV